MTGTVNQMSQIQRNEFSENRKVFLKSVGNEKEAKEYRNRFAQADVVTRLKLVGGL